MQVVEKIVVPWKLEIGWVCDCDFDEIERPEEFFVLREMIANYTMMKGWEIDVRHYPGSYADYFWSFKRGERVIYRGEEQDGRSVLLSLFADNKTWLENFCRQFNITTVSTEIRPNGIIRVESVSEDNLKKILGA